MKTGKRSWEDKLTLGCTGETVSSPQRDWDKLWVSLGAFWPAMGSVAPVSAGWTFNEEEPNFMITALQMLLPPELQFIALHTSRPPRTGTEAAEHAPLMRFRGVLTEMNGQRSASDIQSVQ